MEDIVIVGGGHNGLVAAAYLARSGRRVLVLERRSTVGGAVATEELFPGFHISSCSFTTHVLQDRVVTDLELHRHGYRVHRLDPELFVPFPDGHRIVLWRDIARTQREIASISQHDAARFPAWCDFWLRVARLLDPYFLDQHPPTLDELVERLAGTEDGRLLDRLIHSPVREVLDEHFESPQVQAAVLGNVDLRSLDEPGDLLGWASVKPNLLVDPQNQGLVPGGMGTLASAFAGAARAAGAVIRTGAEVRRIVVDDRGAACGVELVDGQVIRAGTVVSNADPKRTFLRLLDPDAVGPELTAQIGRLETLSGSVKLHAAVSELPDFGRYVDGPVDPRAVAMVRIAPSISYVTDSLADAANGLPTRSPIITLQIPTVYDPTIAPPGRHVVSMWVKFQPTRLASGSWDAVRDTVHEQLIETVTRYAPNFRRSIIDSILYTPLDMEQRVGLTDGNIHHLDHSVTQLLGDRLFPGGGYRTPIARLYMCGAGTHPGGEVSGAPGHNAAMIVLADLTAQERSPRT
jgi:phytoene dehydrogenase-like protein